MKTKLLNTILIISIVFILSACSSSESVSVAVDTPPQEIIIVPPSSETPTAQPDISPLENIPALEVTETPEVIEAQEVLVIEPLWYMDSDGIKNKDLELQISKTESFPELRVYFQTEVLDEINPNTGLMYYSVKNLPFSCYFYDGDVDESSDLTGEWNGLPYTYYDQGSSIYVYIIKNGIVLRTIIEDTDNENETKDMEAYINNYFDTLEILIPCDDFPLTCLAFLATDGLYLPALNLKLTTTTPQYKVTITSVRCYASKYDTSTRHSTYMEINEESINNPRNADNFVRNTTDVLEVMDNFINYNTSPNSDGKQEYFAIEDTANTTIGKHNFIGRGIIENTTSEHANEKWFFYSNTSTWSIKIQYQVGDNYQKYLDLLKPLE